MAKSVTGGIPNSITCLNLISGCIAIFMAFHSADTFGALSGAHWAMIAIGAASLFDFLDGASARLLKRYSPLGKDLDSLSDMVSFGVAPAMLILNVMMAHAEHPWMAFAALMIPVCGALRLAKFNNDAEQTTIFRGLPIPANAIFWIGAAGWIETYGYPSTAVMIVAIVLVSLAMVAKFKMFSLKFKNFDIHVNFCRYAILTAAVFFVAIYGVSGFIWTILLYVVLSLLRQKRI